MTAETTLSNRDQMGFRMLIGREALRQGFVVDPAASFLGRAPQARHPPTQPGPLMAARPSFAIGTVRIRPGTPASVELPITKLVTGAEVSLPVRVVHGREDGPTVWVNAAIHGDEVVGVEVIRRVLADLSPKTLRGTLIAVPIVNVLGSMTADRYLPDRRDLNRSFPGSARGSLAAPDRAPDDDRGGRQVRGRHRPAHRLGPAHQPAADPRRPGRPDAPAALAEAFGAPVMLHAKLRDGSLRHAARRARRHRAALRGAARRWRFDEWAIDAGVDGVRRVLAALGMVDAAGSEPDPASRSAWSVGAAAGSRHAAPGILHLDVDARPAGRGGRPARRALRLVRPDACALVHADRAGIVIGRTTAPLVNRGDALVHLAEIEGAEPPGTPDHPDAADGFDALDEIPVPLAPTVASADVVALAAAIRRRNRPRYAVRSPAVEAWPAWTPEQCSTS